MTDFGHFFPDLRGPSFWACRLLGATNAAGFPGWGLRARTEKRRQNRKALLVGDRVGGSAGFFRTDCFSVPLLEVSVHFLLMLLC